MKIYKTSVDARKKDNIHYAYVVDVEVKNEKRKVKDGKATKLKWNNINSLRRKLLL